MEIEAKFSAPDAATLEHLRELDELAGFELGAGETAQMSDVYLDTDDRALQGAGLFCRRRDLGDRTLLTVKRRGSGKPGAVHRRDEWELELPHDLAPDAGPDEWPAGEAREQVAKAARGRPLQPLAEIRQTRVARAVTRDGHTVAELSLDTLTFVVGDGVQAPQYEVEAELKGEGAEAELAVLAEALQRDFGLVPQPLSKFERALAALDAGAPAGALLSADEERLLGRIARRTDAAGRRARALLAVHAGALQRDAAAKAGMAPRTVRYWLNRFQHEGLAIFPARLVSAVKRRSGAAEGGETAAATEAAPDKTTASDDAPGKSAARAVRDKAAAAAAAVLAKAAPVAGRKTRRPARPGIRATDTMAEAAFKTLRFHCDRMLDHEAGTRVGDDPEDLHDMRVATRRMRAALRVFAPYLDARTMHPIERGLRRTGRVLGAVRDLDVFHEKTMHYLDGLPAERRGELDPLLDIWHEQRDEARAALLTYLDGDRYPRFVEAFTALLDDPGRAALPIMTAEQEARPHRVSLVLPAVVYDRVTAVWAYDDVVGGHDTPLPRFHRLRIAGKAMRYTLEFFEEVLGAEAKPLIGATKNMQDHLGDLQDAVVTCTILRNFLTWGRWEPPATNARRDMTMLVAPGVAAYLAARQAELNRLVDTFPEMWVTIRGDGFSRRLARVIGEL
ncbi:MAG TPA: CHAD domain-containing protein [Thermoleophilia bacterium]|nr:CHAD domain-containing protein [Thermoleophilia bacterium]